VTHQILDIVDAVRQVPDTSLPEVASAVALGFAALAYNEDFQPNWATFFADDSGNDDQQFKQRFCDLDELLVQLLLREAVAALQQVGPVDPQKLCLSAKVSGIHWYCMHPSRAAEACAGYNNAHGADAYFDIAQMLSSVAAQAGRPVLFNFTCLEMNNWNVDMPHTFSAPEDLIAQVRRACVAHNVPLSGENALEFNLADGAWAFDQMKKQLRGWSSGRDAMHGLTILRLKEEFVSEASLKALREFVVSFPA